MTVVADSLRAAVEGRAGQRCEYCHVWSRGQVGTFPVDHVQPIVAGGPTILSNLALTCPCCNGHKWRHTEGEDPTTGQTCPLYNPRTDSWADHFEWSAADAGVLVGKTPCGRATIARLQINQPEQVETRCLLAQLGLFAEILVARPGESPD
jgi:hypothetical protein